MKTLSSPAYQQFTILLRQARLQAGLNQEDVAARLRRPQSYVSKYESGERRLDVIEYMEVCAAIGISPHEIIESMASS